MKKKTNFYIHQMDRFLGFLKNLSEEELHKIEKGESIIQFDIIGKMNIAQQHVKEESNIKGDEIVFYLNNLNSRDKGFLYLEEIGVSKKQLEDIIRILDLPFTKKDNAEKLKEKIIESTIGYRLRSQAIQQTY